MLTWDEVARLATLLHGIPVLGYRPGSPAARAGVKYGDILTMVNNVPTPDWPRARRKLTSPLRT